MKEKLKMMKNYLKNFIKIKDIIMLNIKSSYAKNINNEFFELNFNIDAGEKYFFNDI